MAHVVAQEVRLPSVGHPAPILEGILTRPEEDESPPLRAACLLCHPQPVSSSMDDALLSTLALALAEAGLIVLRFNFRGVGASEGVQTDGRLEPLDVAGAVAFLLAQAGVNQQKLCLIGHGFGAIMALTYATHDTRVRTVVAISPPLFRITPELGAFERPRLFVTGEFDEVAPRYKLEPWIAQLPGSRNLRVISGARHLMHGHEATAASTIVKYVTHWAETPGV